MRIGMRYIKINVFIFNLVLFYFCNSNLVENKDHQALPRYFVLEKVRIQFMRMKKCLRLVISQLLILCITYITVINVI